MDEEKSTIQWPYIPNSEAKVKEEMLKYLGIASIEELYEDIPEKLRLKRPLNVPDPLLSEYALRRYIEQTLSKNKTCMEFLNFLGAGCYQHYVPAICDEVNSRGEHILCIFRVMPRGVRLVTITILPLISFFRSP